jgi:serine/threonine protein kinase
MHIFICLSTRDCTCPPDVLALANCDWVVKLKSSFQDERHLFLIMEFANGGDFMTVCVCMCVCAVCG